MVVFLSLLPSFATADETRPWAGPVVELRLGRTLTEHEFGYANENQVAVFGFNDAATVSGLKVGWRFPLGDNLTFGPMIAYYGDGVAATASGEYTPEAVSATVSYRETRAATTGLQLGADISKGWYLYGEAGYVGQELELSGQAMVATELLSESETRYLIGTYAELGVAKALGPHTYVAGALQGRRYRHADEGMTADRQDVSFWLGVGLKW